MCTFNGERFLQEQLASFHAQTHPPAELVVCDDSSEDGTLEQLRSFAESAAFPVRVVQNTRKLGYSRNFAQAIGVCTGDVIALSDQDDRWYPQKLQRFEHMFAVNPTAGGIFSDGDLMNMESQPLPGTLWKSFDFKQADRERIASGDGIRVLLRRNVVTGMAFAFRREWRETLRVMPAHWPHDFWMALMLAEHNALRACPERLVAYRVHGNQQIGIPITRAEKFTRFRTRGVGAYLALSRERNVREYTKDAVQFESLMRAAAGSTGISENGSPGSDAGAVTSLAHRWWIPLAQQKALHLRRGVLQLEQSRARRWASALYHWKSYRDYSPTGLSALMRDLLI